MSGPLCFFGLPCVIPSSSDEVPMSVNPDELRTFPPEEFEIEIEG